MRKVTKNKHRKARSRARARATARARARAITKSNIKHNKGRGPDDPAYKEAVDKITLIFGKKILDNAMHYGKAKYIQKLIDLINMEKSKHSTNISNEEQITKILHPALQDLLIYIRDDYTLDVPFIGTTRPLQLVIPRVVSVNTVLSPKRINDILAIAEKNKFVEDQLIEEFIKNLTVLKTGFKSSVVVPDLPSASLPARASLPVRAHLEVPARAHLEVPASLPARASLPVYLPLPVPLPAPVHLPAPVQLPAPLPRPALYKSPRTTKSPRESPYSAKYPVPVQALRVRVTTTKNPNALTVDPKDVTIFNRVGQGKNFKKTRRHK
jgi:hypothetical protein